MHTAHQPAGHTFTATLLKIVRQTELLLERRVEATERADALHSLEVTESTWGEWEQAMLEWKPAQIR
ncbi:hypothetical protein [Paucibacter sp. DJ2R-2]|uniref:hypothetical protein n=1 Tax=Paucibacter sp. DJ2R-2 TaxID=2893558 RepID=UPI0021E45A0A|nr:hypothetical protein [Paucibacter sp. DJ2R-2]MCV2437200.1 hypothetical protein [Paucibacter sp. DJ2R-2]